MYVLTQTFHVIKDQCFLSSLFRAIFASKLPASMVARIEAQEKNGANQIAPPSNWFYSGQFKCVHQSKLSFEQLVTGYCNTDLPAFEGFLYQQCSSVPYLAEMREEVLDLYKQDEAKRNLLVSIQQLQ